MECPSDAVASPGCGFWGFEFAGPPHRRFRPTPSDGGIARFPIRKTTFGPFFNERCDVSARTPNRRITVRFTLDEERRLKASMERRGFATASAFIRDTLHREFASHDEMADAEGRLVATLDRIGREVHSARRVQQASFAVIDTLVKTFLTGLTGVPEPPQGGMPQSVARARDRYARFVKSSGQAMSGDSQAAMDALVNRVD